MTKAYKNSIPKEVMDIASGKGKEFLSFSNNLSVDAAFGWKSINITESLPYKSSYCTFNPKDAVRTKLVKLYEDWQNEKTDYSESYQEVKNGIYALRTHAKLKNDWPEAAKHIPKTITTLPSVNVDLIKTKIK